MFKRVIFLLFGISFWALWLASQPAPAQSPTLHADQVLTSLSRLDRDGDGTLAIDQLPLRTRATVSELVRRVGMDPNQPVVLTRLRDQLIRQTNGRDTRDSRGGRRFDFRRGGDEDRPAGRGDFDPRRRGGGREGEESRREFSGRGRGDDSRGRRWSGRDQDQQRDDRRGPGGGNGAGITVVSPSLPGFGLAGDLPAVPGFGVPAQRPLEELYDDRIVRFTSRLLERYDRNENGVLDGDELQNARMIGSPDEADQNRDGRVDPHELAERLSARFSENRDRDRDRGPSRRDASDRDRRSSRQMTRNVSRDEQARGEDGDRRRGSRGWGRGNNQDNGEERQPGWGRGRNGEEGGRRSWGGDRSRAGDAEDGDRRSRFAQMLFRRFDQNEDGVLDQDEASQLRGGAAEADANGDGRITSEELTAQMQQAGPGRGRGGGFGGGRGEGPRERGRQDFSRGTATRSANPPREEDNGQTSKRSYRFLSPVERLPDGLPEWFFANDWDGDGQITMSEYSSSWSQELADEFAGLDRNNDGMITAQECLKSVEDQPRGRGRGSYWGR